jgi:hypothetical protein
MTIHFKSSKYLPLIEKLSMLNPPLFIFGGFAEDALLYQKITREHDDLDVLVKRDELEKRLEQFKELGFKEFEVYYEPLPKLPLVIHSIYQSLHLEPGILDKEEDEYYFVIDDAEETKIKVFLPADTFTYPKTLLEGIFVQTVSPLALYQIRQAFITSGTFGELREKDIKAQAKLEEKFFSDTPESWLQPKIARLGQ